MQIQVYHLHLFREKKWTRKMREVTVDKSISVSGTAYFGGL